MFAVYYLLKDSLRFPRISNLFFQSETKRSSKCFLPIQHPSAALSRKTSPKVHGRTDETSVGKLRGRRFKLQPLGESLLPRTREDRHSGGTGTLGVFCCHDRIISYRFWTIFDPKSGNCKLHGNGWILSNRRIYKLFRQIFRSGIKRLDDP